MRQANQGALEFCQRQLAWAASEEGHLQLLAVFEFAYDRDIGRLHPK
jgi:hypothetical protein